MLGRVAYDAWTVPVPTPGGRYSEALLAQPNALNPLLAMGNPVDREFLPLLFAGLTQLAPDGSVRPDLAERWEVSADGQTYTFFLRPNLRWSDGTPLEAADVVFTYEALRDPDFPADPAFLAPWREVRAEALDARTVRCTLARPWAGFLEAATLGIVPRRHLAGTTGRAWLSQPFNYAPVGSGPYRLQERTVEELVLVPNEYYHGPPPYLAELRFRLYPSVQAAQDALLAGAVDGLALHGGGEPRLPANGAGLALYRRPDYARTVVLWLNTAQPPFDEREVRVAAAQAIDRARLVTEVDGAAEPARGPLPPSSWAYTAEVALPTYAPDQARALLERAGWRAGAAGERSRNGTPLAITLLTNDDPARRRAAEAVARDLRAVGFRVQVAARPWAELAREELAPQHYQAVLLGQWTPTADPDGLRALWASDGVGNLAGWRQVRADELLAQGATATDQAARRAAYAAFQALWAEEVPSIPLYYVAFTWVVRADLQGVDLAPLWDSSQRLALLPQWYRYTARVFRGW
ncbi:MAG TPA: peptide ABC transporter substrate-binding protein [Chloroflexota bacterium]|nr:peptide ABC transporter substrate-binding protein [Chloroflexota bacterium]